MMIFHILLILSVIGIGFKSGVLLSSLITSISPIIASSVGGVFSLFVIWPSYRILGWLPPLPSCPNGHGVNWLSLSTNGLELKWSCRTCGITIIHRKFIIDVLDQHGNVDYHLIKKYPYWLNGWRTVQWNET